MSMWIIWLIVLIVALVIEALTLGLATVWIAAGALVALIMDLCGASVMAQIITMLIVSVVCFVVCIIWIKPLIDDKRTKDIEPTNADRAIGQEAIVIKAINVNDCTGQVKVLGQVWSAIADTDIPKDSKVKVLSMTGVKLKVELIQNEEE